MNLLDTLEQYHKEGWLIKQTHPTLPLTIWNYSQTTQYEGKWDEVTLMCRGLVTDDMGNIVARPFKKFFNMEEHKHTPTYVFDVFAKEDGSLIIAFQYKGSWVIASRGSFTSDQAIAAEKLFYKLEYHEKLDNPEYTHLFEYCSDWNRIVVRYDTERLILLGMVENTTGNELSIDVLRSDFFQKEMGFLDVVKKYDGISDYTTLKGMIGNNEEGFVIRFSNGDKMKIKGEEYLRLHKIMTGVSTTSIWDVLSSGGNMEEVLKEVPDEFYDKIKEVVQDLVLKFESIQKNYLQHYLDITDKIVSTNKKAFAEEAKKYTHPEILFAMLSGKDVTPFIWKIVKPEWKKL
jgi:RNA ligase